MAAEPESPPPSFTAEQVQLFEREVAPILKANCVACHGGEKKVQSGRFLTSREGVLKGGENGPGVVLNNIDESTLLDAIVAPISAMISFGFLRLLVLLPRCWTLAILRTSPKAAQAILEPARRTPRRPEVAAVSRTDAR